MVCLLSNRPWPSPTANPEPGSWPGPRVGDRGLARRQPSRRRASRRTGRRGLRARIEADGRWNTAQIAQLFGHRLEGAVFPFPRHIATDCKRCGGPATKPEGNSRLPAHSGRANGEGQAGRGENGRDHHCPAACIGHPPRCPGSAIGCHGLPAKAAAPRLAATMRLRTAPALCAGAQAGGPHGAGFRCYRRGGRANVATSDRSPPTNVSRTATLRTEGSRPTKGRTPAGTAKGWPGSQGGSGKIVPGAWPSKPISTLSIAQR